MHAITHTRFSIGRLAEDRGRMACSLAKQKKHTRDWQQVLKKGLHPIIKTTYPGAPCKVLFRIAMPSRAPQRITSVILRVPRLGTVAGRLHPILLKSTMHAHSRALASSLFFFNDTAPERLIRRSPGGALRKLGAIFVDMGRRPEIMPHMQ